MADLSMHVEPPPSATKTSYLNYHNTYVYQTWWDLIHKVTLHDPLIK